MAGWKLNLWIGFTKKPNKKCQGSSFVWGWEINIILVGGFNHLGKYESQWEGWHPIYCGKKNNHQPNIYERCWKTRVANLFGTAKNHWASILNFSEWIIQPAWRLDREHNKFIQFRRPFQVGFVWVICFSSPKYIPTHSYIYNIPLSLLPAQSYAGDKVHARSNIPMKNATNIAERLVAQFQTVLNMENIQELRKLYTCMRFGDLIQVEMCVEYICLTPVRLHWASCHHPAWQETTWPSNCTITDSVHSASPSKI